MRFITIFAGSMPEVLTRQCKLEAFGVQSLIRDWNVKMVDPLITPGGLTFELQVPEEAQAAALEVLGHPGEDVLASTIGTSTEASTPSAPDTADPHVEAELTALRKLGWTIVYGCVLGIFLPYSVWASFGYYRRVREVGQKPENYWLVLIALSVGVPWFVMVVMMGLRLVR